MSAAGFSTPSVAARFQRALLNLPERGLKTRAYRDAYRRVYRRGHTSSERRTMEDHPVTIRGRK